MDLFFAQWRSHWGVKGAECPFDSEKFAINREKEEERNEEKAGLRGKNREKEKNSGRFFHFAPPDR